MRQLLFGLFAHEQGLRQAKAHTWLMVMALGGGWGMASATQMPETSSAAALSRLSLEELGQIEVTSV